MKLKTVEITELKGVNRNAVEGVAQLQPAFLRGFALDRAGGYRKYFDKEDISTSGTFVGTVVGSDDVGLVSLRVYDSSTSFPRGRVTMRVYDGTSTVQEVVDGFDSTSTSFFPQVSTSSSSLKPIHLQQTGLYVYPGDVAYEGLNDATNESPIYLVKDSNGTWRDSVSTESASITTSATFNTGSDFSGEVQIFGGFSTATGTFLWRADSDSSTSDAGSIDITISYSNAPNSWVVYAIVAGANSVVSTPQGKQTLPATGAYYDLQNAVASETVNLSISSTSAVFESGVVIGAMTPPTAMHRERVYGLFNREIQNVANATQGNNFFQQIGAPSFRSLATRLPREKTVWYTEIGYANLWQQQNYFVVPFQASTEITGMASSPAGLLIFGNNETFLMRSDPSLSDFGIQVASGVIGMDADTRPVRLGGTIFAIYKGEVYAFALGMGDVDFGGGIQKISDPIFVPGNPITFLAAEPRERHIVAGYYDSGESETRYWRYDAEAGQWLTDVWSDQAGSLSDFQVFSNPDSNGVRYGSPTIGALKGAHGSVLAGTPQVRFDDVDLGDKNTAKLWRRVRLQTNDSYTGTPALRYSIGGTSGSVTASDEGNNRFVFTLPNGLVSEKATFLRVDFNTPLEGDTIEPPLTIEYVPRYRRR